jgi:hypothetical protein
MVMKRTNAVAVIIHAVSPLSRVSAWATAGMLVKRRAVRAVLVLWNVGRYFEIILCSSIKSVLTLASFGRSRREDAKKN